MTNRIDNRIDARFRDLRLRGEKGLIAYITVGDPDLPTTREVALAIARSGADLIELGLPFSDPLADGPVIQQASQRALAGGFRVAGAFELARSLRRATPIPLTFMSYYNLLLQYGLSGFAREAAAAGVDGLLVPDLPFEESGELGAACSSHGLHLIPFLAPTSTPARIAMAAREAQGFIYCVSLTGVTGVRERLPERLAAMLAGIRLATDVPLAVGFGISDAAQARQVAKWADAVIVGSAIVDRIAQGGTPQAVANRVGGFVAELKSVLREGVHAAADG